jgi:hypothetical protein
MMAPEMLVVIATGFVSLRTVDIERAFKAYKLGNTGNSGNAHANDLIR